jgi:uncharacterized membrane protein
VPARTVWHQIQARPRLAISTIVGILLFCFLPRSVSGPTRFLASWDAATVLYLILAWALMLGTNVEGMRRNARQQDDGAAVVLGLSVAAGLATLAAIFLELVGVRELGQHEKIVHIALATTTILCSWGFVHTAFALHYAHDFYTTESRRGGGCLQFPGGGNPDYGDFLYFSFVIGTTSQTADVSIASRSLRRLALLHGVISFFFNTTLLALAINMAAGLL